jgi:shikimate kinase
VILGRVDSVALIGMPGAGKSTVGVLLARALALGFFDTDLVIQVREGATLEAILARAGYQSLREVEARILLDLDPRGAVVATGGSAVHGDAAMRHLAAHGPIVFLDVPLDELHRRLPDLAGRGIAGPPGSTLESLAAERVPLYRHYADIVVSCALESTGATVRRVVAALDAARKSDKSG